MTTIGHNIKSLRTDKGMSQESLAAAMQLAGQGHWRQNTVSRVERDRQCLDLHEAAALINILGNVLAGTYEQAVLREAVAA